MIHPTTTTTQVMSSMVRFRAMIFDRSCASFRRPVDLRTPTRAISLLLQGLCVDKSHFGSSFALILSMSYGSSSPSFFSSSSPPVSFSSG